MDWHALSRAAGVSQWRLRYGTFELSEAFALSDTLKIDLDQIFGLDGLQRPPMPPPDAPMPAWAEMSDAWYLDRDGSACRWVKFPLFVDDPELGALEATQDWDPETGRVTTGPAEINFGGLESLDDSGEVPLATEARMLAARLIEAAERLEAHRSSSNG
jgi:hypothetical protein